MTTFYYLYCLRDKTQRKFSLAGLDGKKVYTLPHKDIEAVVTEVSSKEFSPQKIKSKLDDLKWTEEKVRNHESVIREAMEEGAVVPLKFLTIYKSKAKIENILKKQFGEFRQLLNKLKGKTEWGLKIYAVNKENLMEAMKKEDEEIVKLKAELSEKPEGVKYFLEKKMQGRISEKLNAQLDKYIKDIFEIFLPFSTEKPMINKLLPEGLGDKGREMILNVSYLIPNGKAGEFQGTVRRMHEFYSPKGLWLEHTGPWPPYSFVNYDGSKNKKTN